MRFPDSQTTTPATATGRMKEVADDIDEVKDIHTFADTSNNTVTPVMQWPPAIAQAIVEGLASVVRAGHASEAASSPDDEGITRAQVFEEGDVYMLARPYDGYFADRYLMDFYDVTDRDICSRMHLHTGLRFVRMMTGIDTMIRVSSLSPFWVTQVPGVTAFALEGFTDPYPDEPALLRYNLLVPPCSWVDMQVPRAQSHQFNALGPNAVIDSVHPEESIEIFREAMTDVRMMAQTIFLSDERPPSATCSTLPADLATASPASSG